MSGTIDTVEYLKLSSGKCGMIRESYVEGNIPVSLSNITVMPFFGDMRSQFVLSTLLLHRYLSAINPDRYFILCSYPGLAGLFPYVDEYWSYSDESVMTEFMSKACGFSLDNDKLLFITRSLREWFREVVTWEDSFSNYYDCGLSKGFFDTFGKVHVAIPALKSLKMDLNKMLAKASGYTVFIHPTKVARTWHNKYVTYKVDKGFWRDLLGRLIGNGITPIVWQNAACHDLSSEFIGKGVFFMEKNVLDVLAVMRTCHCVLDVHGGLSRYAAVARCPFLCVEDRHKFIGLKEYELDDLCLLNKFYKYIFSFITILENKKWSQLVDNIANKLEEMLPQVNKNEFPTTAEHTAIVSYKNVRSKKTKRIGSKFIKVPRM